MVVVVAVGAAAVVVVLWMGKCVKKNRAQDGGSARTGECVKDNRADSASVLCAMVVGLKNTECAVLHCHCF